MERVERDSAVIDLAQVVKTKGVHFLDFGCSTGGSLRRFSSLYGGTAVGLGLDMDPAKVDAARQAGCLAEVFDINELGDTKVRVNFVSMSHFLEHLPSMQHASRAIQVACKIARDFVVIVQPNFDADGLLLRHGCKAYWSDWSGHPNRMTTLEFHNVLRPLAAAGAISRFIIYGRDKITSLADERLIDLEAPTNSGRRTPNDVQSDASMLSAQSPLPFAVYAETVILVEKQKCPVEWLQNKLGKLDQLYQSA